MTYLLDERPLTLNELVKLGPELSAHDLVLALRDGRAVVRANAALGLAVIGHQGRDLVPFLRDSDPIVARAAAEALLHLGVKQREHLAAIAAALDGARPEVADLVVQMFSAMIGQADGEVIGVLDTVERDAAKAVVDACADVGTQGLHLLQHGADDDRLLVRLNAVRGVGKLATAEPATAIAVMNRLATEDEVSDVRATAMIALAAYRARVRAEAAWLAGQPVASKVPELLNRALTADELKAAATDARLEELIAALDDPRAAIRINGVRVLALQGAAAAAAAPVLALGSRDPDVIVRRESVAALAALGKTGVDVASSLVRALGDLDLAVVAKAEEALAAQGAAAADALTAGLAVTNELHGKRIASLLGRLPDGANRLREALESTSVDARVHAALGLAGLGKRAGNVLAALSAATLGGNARVRAAVATAIAAIDPRPDTTPAPLPIDGFEERVLTEAELGKHRGALAAAGIAGLTARLGDPFPSVRANAALALGVLGGDADAVAAGLAVCLRDDAEVVGTSAARALARVGEPVVVACAGEIVRALRGASPALAGLLGELLRGSADPATGLALVRGLDTVDDVHGRALCELIGARADAVDLLCEAFDRPGAQARAADGFMMLGKERLGRGRAVLARARTAQESHVRNLARATLLAIDGPPVAPTVPAIAGFETTLLDRGALSTSLDVGGLIPFLADGRPVVRANAATALGAQGKQAAPYAITIAALLRDDDSQVRLAAARALDQLGDDTVVAVAPNLVRALGADDALAEVVRAALAARKGLVEAALVAGLDTVDQTHGVRIAELIGALPNGRELLFAAFDGPAHNVQINAALGIGKLGRKRAGADGVRRLLSGLPGPPTRRRYAMLAALAMLGIDPAVAR